MRSTPRRSGADLAGSVVPETPRLVFCVALAFALLAPREARAMHLADGVLPAPWCVAWTAFAAPVDRDIETLSLGERKRYSARGRAGTCSRRRRFSRAPGCVASGRSSSGPARSPAGPGNQR